MKQDQISDRSSSTGSTLSIGINGLTCASCVLRVEMAIGKIEGIHKVTVNLATDKALIKSQKAVSSNTIQKAIEDVGYSLENETVRLSICPLSPKMTHPLLKV